MGGERQKRKRYFDLFMGSPNQLQTHWTALTLISFCSTSYWAPLSSSHLFGMLNLAKQKFPPSHTRIKQWKHRFLNWGCWRQRRGALQLHQRARLLSSYLPINQAAPSSLQPYREPKSRRLKKPAPGVWELYQ